MESPYDPVKPSIFYMNSNMGNYVDIRLNPKMSTHQALAVVGKIFTQYDPENPFDYQFTDTEYARKFADEERIGKLAGFFTLVAIFISCMGLFGMASFVAEQRTKEIGIRKVLGATVSQVWLLLSRDFIVLVLISCLIASPVAYYFLHQWLLKYDYRISIGPGIFIISAVLALLITMITVSSQAIRAALANPAKSLKTE